MTRKPFLGWEDDGYHETYGERLDAVVGMYRLSLVTQGRGKGKIRATFAPVETGDPEYLMDYPSPDEAKLACEDYLATLLEPLAKTYEKLRGNR